MDHALDHPALDHPALDHPALDYPLPPELTGNAHGWLSRYRRYPVFSPAWARGRTLVFGVVAVLATLTLCAPMLLGPADEVPLGGIVQVMVQIAAAGGRALPGRMGAPPGLAAGA